MEKPLYMSLLPKDVQNIVNLNILFNYDYNHFIEYCTRNNCDENIWKRKGIMDFPNFEKTLGITYKANYLRKAARAEFDRLRKLADSKSKEKELIQVREGNYRHEAKLLDYSGKYDNFRSYNYILPKKLINKLNKGTNQHSGSNRQIFASYVPEDDEDSGNYWIVMLRDDQDILYFIVKSYSGFRVYNDQQYPQVIQYLRDYSGGLNTKNMTANDILRIYDYTTSSP